jgi:hypothetical protein
MHLLSQLTNKAYLVNYVQILFVLFSINTKPYNLAEFEP